MNARLPKLFLALCLGAGTLALGGCQKEEIPPKTEFVLFDLSASTASREVRARYLEDFEKLLANMRGGRHPGRRSHHQQPAGAIDLSGQ